MLPRTTPELAEVTLHTAAAFVRQSGLRVWVVVPREAGVVALARAIADEVGLEVEVELTAGMVSVGFSMD